MSEDRVIPVRWNVDEEPVNILMRKEDEKKNIKEWLKDHIHPNGEECKCPNDIGNRTFGLASLDPIELPRVIAVKFNPSEEWKYLLYREEDEKKSRWDFLHDHVHHDESPCECPKLKSGQNVSFYELEPVLSDETWKGFRLIPTDEFREKGWKAWDERSEEKVRKIDKKGENPSCVVNVKSLKSNPIKYV